MYIVFEAGMLISLCGLIYVFQNDYAVLTIVLKTIASLFFVLTGLCGFLKSKENRRFTTLMLIALVCAMAGDVLLAIDGGAQSILFILGVVSFAATHVLYSVSYCRTKAVSKKNIIAAVIVFVGCTALLCIGNFDFQGLLPVLLGYAAIISFMTVKAVSLYSCRVGKERAVWLIIVGSVLFLLSDMVLLFFLFGIDVPKEAQSLCWLLYYPAQGCIAAALNERDLQFTAK